MESIKGQQIRKIQTLDSSYNVGILGVYDDKNNYYKMKVEEIMRINTDFNDVIFDITQKRVYKYLSVRE